jgi:hypothetical protein
MENLVTVGTYLDYFSANAMLQVLEDSGIKARLLNEHSGTILPSMAVGGIKLQVLAEEAAAAQKIILAIESEQSEPGDAF